MPVSSITELSPIPGTPLALRARLWDRRAGSVRRYAARVGSRTAVLITGDLLALLGARFLLRTVVALVSPTWFQVFDSAGPLAAPGKPGSLIFGAALFLALALTGSYGQQRKLNYVARIAGAVVIAAVATVVVVAAAVGVSRAIAETAGFAATAWSSLVAVRVLAERVLTRIWPGGRHAAVAVLAGPAESLDSAPARALNASSGEYSIGARHVIDPSEMFDVGRLRAEIRSILGKADAEALVLCDVLPEPQVRALLDAAIDADCVLLYPARALALDGVHPRLVWHHDRPFLELGAPMLRPHALITKRITDAVLSAILLVLTAPFMLLIAAAVRLDSPGPAIFTQNRAGLGGRRFRMLKFRTMWEDADELKQRVAHLNHTGDGRLFKIPRDPRVTRFGGFLRRWSLDELPQLINVLRGEMSLVGPRPFFESDFAAYEDHHFRRLDTKPGLTGLWQVSGRSDVVDFEDVVYLDRQYIEQWSFWLDLSILFRTVPAVFSRTGAY